METVTKWAENIVNIVIIIVIIMNIKKKVVL